MLASTITLAFFYMVIGELITFHQRAIFNFDAFANQPLIKPDKTGKDNLYKLKDKKDRILINYLTFISEYLELHESKIYISDAVRQYPCFSKFHKDCHHSSISFRGPPALS
ncbi:MAG: hypothetical protein ISR56_01610 [Bacteroidales bacterium]|nr:hypothetical protein [Bacteroidales bacterium]